ncbi:hypothetical protein [Undibacterium sp.]|uniref:hypothetical protein n=1 Tax=Undibacterium sp. TaxID=1914977 RepID=UPI0027308572|nr:hypothetical protein [Undibacterium sp.]MDP1979220.1 hypothetical protein [Undibacterium sp.]
MVNSDASKVEGGLKRLMQIEFERSDYDQELAANLACEYIRRVAVMSEQEQIALPSPFFDPLTILSIDGHAAKHAMLEFQSTAGAQVKNAYLRRTCECFLQWCEGIDAGKVIAIQYAELFEPLIRLIELGGSFGFHHGDLVVGTSAVPLRDWKRLG